MLKLATPTISSHPYISYPCPCELVLYFYKSILPSHAHFSSFSIMAYQKARLNLKLEMKDIVLVKPSKSIPSCILSLSTLDNIYINNNLCHFVHVYRSSTIHDSDSGFHPSHVFKEALSKALDYYYPLAGILVKKKFYND
ncbi:putative taxadien-5-alpha-ol O-acetyltransferase [Medicago truncatula]|uniref:Putative taxadien-5-alpha-ol O-acetyltransferase n=1 Tax=Medicago truncatula TaxID=3880 RepID=A0A396IT09_MEDTR|nr:putative taxadien-5-alpha-ol O-acetyltransferase [Medicago truncatula]